MIATINIDSKQLGNKELLSNFRLTFSDGEKVALIGRNGVGKSTLFNLLSGKDDDYEGSVQWRRGTIVVSTAQEHHDLGEETSLQYVLANLPSFAELQHIIDTYPTHMGSDSKKIETYSDAITRFTELGYFEAEDRVIRTLEAYQIPEALAKQPMTQLSGGQKRFVELAKITCSEAHIALIDEPTNHMDYIAKAKFIEWFKSTSAAVCVISHDRDVLRYVDRIVELKDKHAVSFKGNYNDYLKQNSVTTITSMGQYEIAQRTIEKLHTQIQQVRAKKASTSKVPNPFIPLEKRLVKQYDELFANTKKPTFWVDQQSVELMSEKVLESYDKYKAKNIRVQTKSDSVAGKLLLTVRDISLGYDKPIFENVGFDIRNGERLQIRGRNGAGKTSLVRTLLHAVGQSDTTAKLFEGTIKFQTGTSIGIYEQEIDHALLGETLGDAIMAAYRKHDKPVNDQVVRKMLSMYLFDATADYDLCLEQLSGGQKARYQLIAMLAGEPNLLILDEPTNHLDLPSIEEIERALTNYQGAILYISHDSYFAEKLGGYTIQIGRE